MTDYYCMECLNKITPYKERKRVQCPKCGKRRTVKRKTLMEATRKYSDLPQPYGDLSSFTNPSDLEKLPIPNFLIECDGRIRRPLFYLVTRVEKVFKKWEEMSKDSNLKDEIFDKAVQKVRKRIS